MGPVARAEGQVVFRGGRRDQGVGHAQAGRKPVREKWLPRHSSLLVNEISRVLTYSHIRYMVIWMKTTLNIDDSVMALLKQEAARRGCTMSELVESALRLLLTAKEGPRAMPPLPLFKSGGALVEIADREALYEAMEHR
jgi:hypothetical protein